MSDKRSNEIFKYFKLIMLFVPVGILAIDILVPLRPLAQQALVGITLLWFDIELLMAFPFLNWK